MTTLGISKSSILKDINFQKIIAGILIAGVCLLSTMVIVFVGYLVKHFVSEFGYTFEGVVSLYWGLANKWIVAIMILIVLWGLTLFFRYIRLCQEKLKTLSRRLWVETILVNVLCLSILYLGRGVVIPYSVVLTCWTVFAILLAGSALEVERRQLA